MLVRSLSIREDDDLRGGGDKMLLDDDSDIMCNRVFYTREQLALG